MGVSLVFLPNYAYPVFGPFIRGLGPAGIYAVRTYGPQLMVLLLTVLLGWTILPLVITYFILVQTLNLNPSHDLYPINFKRLLSLDHPMTW